MRVGGGTKLVHCKKCGFDHLQCMPCIKRLTPEEEHLELMKMIEDNRKFQERSKNSNYEVGARVCNA